MLSNQGNENLAEFFPIYFTHFNVSRKMTQNKPETKCRITTLRRSLEVEM